MVTTNELADQTPTDQQAEMNIDYYEQEYVNNSTNEPKNF